MFALSLAASLALSGVFWGWALQTGGAAIDARTAARIFGWLCVASIAAGFAFALRRKTAYDRPSAALAGALATTLLTGVAMLYLSYFEWGGPVQAARYAPALAVVYGPPAPPKIEPAAPNPVIHKPVVHKAVAEEPVAKSAAAGKSAASVQPQAADGCSGLEGLERRQCQRCPNESGLSGFVCRENARAEYCAGRDGEPGCPWVRSARSGD
jgi:hypothetical protein